MTETTCHTDPKIFIWSFAEKCLLILISVKREIVTHLKQTNKKEIKLKLNLKSAKCILKFIYKKTDKVRNSVQHSTRDEC